MNLERVRLLIGDDVGIGKSVEAGLIISELVARGDANRCLIVVPAGLREQWQETLSRFFHLDSVIMAGHTRPALERQLLPGQNPWDAFPIIVSSIDYLKRRIGEISEYRWDIVLFDEAHIAARPQSWGGSTQQDKDRWLLLEALGANKKVKHLLLLSATPHNGFTESFTSLIGVLNKDAVGPAGIIRNVAEKHVVQRRRLDIKNWYGHKAPLPERAPVDIPPISLSKEEGSLLRVLREYGNTLYQTEGSIVSQWISLHLQRRALSSPRAITLSLQKRLSAAKKKLRAHMSQDTAQIGPEAESIVLDQDSTSDLQDEERWSRLDVANVPGVQAEVDRLEKLLDMAKSVTVKRDLKLSHLMDMIPSAWRRHPKYPRLLVFTRYKDTLAYVEEQLNKEAKKPNSPLQGISVFTIYGDMSQPDRRRTLKEFESTERSICIATDCISEGLDLQRACAELIHYELVWNPNRLEQRNGRIDRYGQPEPVVYIHNLVREDALDATILEVLIRKSAKIRTDYGFCPPIFSSTGELKKLINRYGGGQLELPFFEEEVAEDVDIDQITKARVAKIVEESFYGQENVRLPEVEAALDATYRAIGHPGEIEGFVESALNLVGAKRTPQPDGTVKIDLTRTDLSDMGDSIQATFDPKIARDDPNLELIDIAHPLMRWLVEKVLRDAAGRKEGRVAARGSGDVREMTAILHVLARYVTQSDHPVLMEELIPVGFLPYTGAALTGDPIALLRAFPAPISHTPEELRDLARDALQAPALQTITDKAVEERRQVLERRQSDIARLRSQSVEGMETVVVASVDLLTLTLVVPSHG